MLDMFMTMDCSATRKDSVREIFEAVAQNFTGIEVPDSVPVIDEPNNRKLSFEIITSFVRKIISSGSGET